MSGELMVSIIFEYPSELAFLIAQKEQNYSGQGIGKVINGKQIFDGLGAHYRAKIFHEKKENLEFE